MNTQTKIRLLMEEVCQRLADVTIYECKGKCGYATYCLSEHLRKIRVPHHLLLGEELQNSAIGQQCRAHFQLQINRFRQTTDVESHKLIQTSLLYKDKPLPALRHIVVLVGARVYDPASYKFGLSSEYSLEEFKRIWSKISTIELSLLSTSRCFEVEVIKKQPFSDQLWFI